MLEIKGLNKKYAKQVVLNDVSFNVENGTICGLLGLNGAGKSTLMKSLCDMIKLDSGQFVFNNKEMVFGEYPKVSAIIETPEFFDNLSCYDNLYAVSLLCNKTNNEEVVESAIHTVGLDYAKDKKVEDFSLGMRQRLYFATLLINNADIIVLDEPFNGIDPICRDLFILLIKKFKKEGKVVIISSHDIKELQDIVDQVVILDSGRVVYDNSNLDGVNIHDVFLEKVSRSGIVY